MKLLFKVVCKDFYQEPESIATLINYASKKKTKYTAGINCAAEPAVAISQFESVIQYFNKRPARYIRHYILSVDAPCSPEYMLQAAYLVASKYLSTNQVFIGVHTDTEHIHAHLIINCVNCYNGNIFSYSNEEHKSFMEYAKSFNIDLEEATTII